MEDEIKPVEEGTQGNPPAAENQNPDRPAQVEGAGSAANGNNGEGRGKDPDWKSKYFAQQRILDKQAKRLDGLDQWREQFKTPVVPKVAVNPDDEQTKYWINPIEATRTIASETVDGKIEKALSTRDLAQNQTQAEAYILSQDYIDPEADADSLREIMEQNGLIHSWNIDPFKTAKAVLKIFKQERGIAEKKSPPKAQAGSVLSGSGHSAASNGKKVWTSKEIRAMSLEEYQKNQDAIETARKEGRVEGAATPQ